MKLCSLQRYSIIRSCDKCIMDNSLLEMHFWEQDGRLHASWWDVCYKREDRRNKASLLDQGILYLNPMCFQKRFRPRFAGRSCEQKRAMVLQERFLKMLGSILAMSLASPSTFLGLLAFMAQAEMQSRQLEGYDHSLIIMTSKQLDDVYLAAVVTSPGGCHVVDRPGSLPHAFFEGIKNFEKRIFIFIYLYFAKVRILSPSLCRLVVGSGMARNIPQGVMFMTFAKFSWWAWRILCMGRYTTLQMMIPPIEKQSSNMSRTSWFQTTALGTVMAQVFRRVVQAWGKNQLLPRIRCPM